MVSLKRFFLLNVSDIGLNMSDLTNCIHVIVIDPDDFPYETLCSSLYMASKYYEQNEIPTLLFPVSYAIDQSIPYNKTYNLWVLNFRYLDPYFKYVDMLIKRNKQEDKVLPFSKVDHGKT